MRDPVVKETDYEQVVRLCGDLNAWQQVACHNKDIFVLVLIRVLGAYLAILPDDMRKILLTTLSDVIAEDQDRVKDFMAKRKRSWPPSIP